MWDLTVTGLAIFSAIYLIGRSADYCIELQSVSTQIDVKSNRVLLNLAKQRHSTIVKAIARYNGWFAIVLMLLWFGNVVILKQHSSFTLFIGYAFIYCFFVWKGIGWFYHPDRHVAPMLHDGFKIGLILFFSPFLLEIINVNVYGHFETLFVRMSFIPQDFFPYLSNVWVLGGMIAIFWWIGWGIVIAGNTVIFGAIAITAIMVSIAAIFFARFLNHLTPEKPLLPICTAISLYYSFFYDR